MAMGAERYGGREVRHYNDIINRVVGGDEDFTRVICEALQANFLAIAQLPTELRESFFQGSRAEISQNAEQRYLEFAAQTTNGEFPTFMRRLLPNTAVTNTPYINASYQNIFINNVVLGEQNYSMLREHAPQLSTQFGAVGSVSNVAVQHHRSTGQPATQEGTTPIPPDSDTDGRINSLLEQRRINERQNGIINADLAILRYSAAPSGCSCNGHHVCQDTSSFANNPNVSPSIVSRIIRRQMCEPNARSDPAG